MKLSQETLVRVLRSLYEAAAFPERWSEFLSQVQQLFGARQVVFMLHDFSSRQSNIVTQIDLDPEANRLYTEHYAQTDEWWKRGKEIVRPGWAGTSQMLCPDEELTKSEFYNDFLRHYGMFHQCGAVLGQEGSHTSAITLLRNKKAGPFGAGHVSLLRLLEPHLQSAIKVHFQVSQIRAQSQSAKWILDLLPKAVFFLDGRGKVIYMNQAAAQLVQDGDVFRLRNGELEASNPREARGLQVLLVGARNSEMLPGIQPGGMMWLTRTSLRSPVSVEVLPFLAAAPPVPGSVSAVVFVTDLARKAPPNVATLRALWKLTEAEADLALKLLNGMTLKEAAGARQTTLSTARSQLKTILGKTGTSRQSDLIALLSRFCLLVPGS